MNESVHTGPNGGFIFAQYRIHPRETADGIGYVSHKTKKLHVAPDSRSLKTSVLEDSSTIIYIYLMWQCPAVALQYRTRYIYIDPEFETIRISARMYIRD